MGKLLDDLRQAIESRQQFEEFKKLKEKCLKVFEETIDVSMEMIGEIASNEWQKMYKKVHIPTVEQQNIKDLFMYKLQRGHINRREFKEQLQLSIDMIEEKYEELKKKAEEAEKRLSDDYDEFFNKDPKDLDDASKYIFFMFSQPEVKKIIETFLKS